MLLVPSLLPHLHQGVRLQLVLWFTLTVSIRISVKITHFSAFDHLHIFTHPAFAKGSFLFECEIWFRATKKKLDGQGISLEPKSITTRSEMSLLNLEFLVDWEMVEWSDITMAC